MDTLPVFEMLISDDPDSELQVSAIALVDEPAIQRNWLSFSADKNPMHFAAVNDDEQIIVGAAMVPDMLIYRFDKKTQKEYNVFFSKQTVKSIAQKFFAKGFQGSANIMHDQGQPVPGTTYFMSWFKDSDKSMVGLEGDYPEGTWFVGAKVSDAETWKKVKDGTIKGFSVEGEFGYLEEPTPEEITLAEIAKALEGPEDESTLEKIKMLVK